MKLLCVIIATILINLAGLVWLLSKPANVMQQIYFAIECVSVIIWVYAIYSIWCRYSIGKANTKCKK